MRYEEQVIEFDFNPVNGWSCIAISEVHKYVSRYHYQALPLWYGFTMRAIEFGHTQHFNNLLALFHLTDIPC